MKLMSFLSDFGLKSNYVSQMKGVALSITDARIIDITHDISPQNIREGAYVLMSAIKHFPIGTVHVAVVDPGVGTIRRGIVITTKTQILVGPDNGLLIPAARYLGNFTVYEITNPNLMSKTISNTFHGRDVFTPIAANILNGIMFDQIGPITNHFVDLDFGKYEIREKTATGNIIYIDSFGNIITNIEGASFRQVLNYDKKIFVRIHDDIDGSLLHEIGDSTILSEPNINTTFQAALNITSEIIPVTLEIFIGGTGTSNPVPSLPDETICFKAGIGSCIDFNTCHSLPGVDCKGNYQCDLFGPNLCCCGA